MQLDIPQPILDVYNQLHSAGYQVYFVGGSVRNMLLGKEVKDWDLTTNATPEEMMQLFPHAFYDNSFGTVGIPIGMNQEGVVRQEDTQKLPTSDQVNENISGGEERQDPDRSGQTTKSIIEVTTFRTERNYTDARHPSEVAWGTTIEEDLERRDFTINAIALDMQNESLIDPFDGQKDLENKIIRAVGNPQARFKEDALRLMRAVRFATQLSCTIDESTWKAMQEDAVLLPRISGERIRDELLKILASEYPYEGIMMLKNAGLLEYILPELLEGIGISQERPGRHHVYDVFEHNVFSLKYCPSTNPLVRFAALIHDIGKPRVESHDENGLVIFYNHEIAGAKIAYDICNRLHFSKKDRQKIVTLIRWHMFTVDEHITDSAVRRFIRRIGVDNVKDMIDVRIGDRLGSGIDESRAESWRLKKFKERIEAQLAPAPFSINDLALDGNDIMKELGIKPGPVVGKLLQTLFEEVDEDLSLNTREHLIARLHEMKKNI